MTIKEKAKRYDELKVTAQELEEDGCFDKITLFDLFPELEESEDERIRKGLIQYFKNFTLNTFAALDPKKILSWLEKQGEQKPADTRTTGYWHVEDVEQKPAWSEEDEINYNYALAACIYYGEAKGYTDTETHQKTIDWLKSLRPQNTWKPSDVQMEVLKKACEEYWEPDGLDPLYTLYKDLKKLRKE